MVFPVLSAVIAIALSKWLFHTLNKRTYAMALVVAALVAVAAAYLVREQNDHETPRRSESAGLTPIQVTGDVFSTDFVLRAGAYRDFDWGSTRVRVDLKQIVRAKISSVDFSSDEVDQAAIGVDLGGSIVYGGSETIKRAVNEYALPVKSRDEEPRSIYWFYIRNDKRDGSFRFCRIVVDHINPRSDEVTLNAFFTEKTKEFR